MEFLNKRMPYPLIYNMFANANTNKTTSNASGNDLSDEMKTYYSDHLIDLAEPELIHDQFADKYPIPRRGGKTIEFRKFTPLGKAMTPLTEGVTPDGQKLDVDTITATVSQYGGYVETTDVLDLTAIDPIVVQATQMIASQAGRTLDTITREVLAGGTNVIYAPAGNTKVESRSAVSATCKITLDVLRKAALILKRQNAPKIDGSYVAIVHPDIAHDIMGLDGWIDVHKYATPENIYNGELGKIAGIRFIENTEAKIWKNAGAAKSGGDGTKENVYGTLVMGAHAYAVTEVTGGGLQHIVKQLGSAGTADPLNQRATVGWKAIKTAEILVNQYIVRIESAASEGDTAIAN